MRTMRILLALFLAPLLLAPVRLKDATPSFFTPPAQSPAPESYSLPAAEPLITPTVIYVSPTVLPASPTTPVTPTSLNLPLPVSATTPTGAAGPVAAPPPYANRMTPLQSALCRRAMALVEELALLSYQQRRNRATLTLSLAATGAGAEAATLHWPNLAAFNKAAGGLPWFGQPQKQEMEDAARAARNLCTP